MTRILHAFTIGRLLAALLLAGLCWIPCAHASQYAAAPVSLLPGLDSMMDETGDMTVEEVAAPQQATRFRPLNMKRLPRKTGAFWLRFTLAPLQPDAKPAPLFLDLGESVPRQAKLHYLATPQSTDDWIEDRPSGTNMLILPEQGSEPRTFYLELPGVPGPWFSPVIRTPRNAAADWVHLAKPAVVLALGVVMLLCFLRLLAERGQWRLWTVLFVGFTLLYGVLGPVAPSATGTSPMTAIILMMPGLALLLLPHVARHLVDTPHVSRSFDLQYLALTLPGALVALAPLIPGFGWVSRYLELWPLGTAVIVPTTLGAYLSGHKGAGRVLTGCLACIVATGLGLFLPESIVPPALAATFPLIGAAACAMLIACTPAPQRQQDTPTEGEPDRLVLAGTDRMAALDLDEALKDPNLRLVPSTDGPTAKGGPQGEALSPEVAERLQSSCDLLLKDATAIAEGPLPPPVRQQVESMKEDAQRIADLVGMTTGNRPRKNATFSPAPFNLQHLMRSCHDAVEGMAANAGIGLAWYMPPHLGHTYMGAGDALASTLRSLLESSIRATRHGAVHFSVRRVPESADAGHLLFTITDTGAAMPPQERSGLALMQAWELADACKGFLGLDCSARGATIAFTVHLVPMQEDGDERADLPLMLITADTAEEREALAARLNVLPCTCIPVAGLPEAIRIHRDRSVSLLIVHGASVDNLRPLMGQFETEAKEGVPFQAMAIVSGERDVTDLERFGIICLTEDAARDDTLENTIRHLLRLPESDPSMDVHGETLTPGFGASPLKIPDLTALPNLLDLAQSLANPLKPGEGQKDSGLFGHLEGLQPADAGTAPTQASPFGGAPEQLTLDKSGQRGAPPSGGAPAQPQAVQPPVSPQPIDKVPDVIPSLDLLPDFTATPTTPTATAMPPLDMGASGALSTPPQQSRPLDMAPLDMSPPAAPSPQSFAAPVQPSPAQPAPVQFAPVQPTPVQPAPMQPAPIQPAPMQPSPVQPAPVQPTPIPWTAAPTTPVQPAPEQWPQTQYAAPPSSFIQEPAQPASVQPQPAAPELREPSVPVQPIYEEGQASTTQRPHETAARRGVRSTVRPTRTPVATPAPTRLQKPAPSARTEPIAPSPADDAQTRIAPGQRRSSPMDVFFNNNEEEDEWVGEPTPIQNSRQSRPTMDEPAPGPHRPAREPAAPAYAGEWVGEPVPIPRTGTPSQPSPLGKDSQEEPQDESLFDGSSILGMIAGTNEPPAQAPAPHRAPAPNAAQQRYPAETVRQCEFLAETMNDIISGFSQQRPTLVAEAARRLGSQTNVLGWRTLSRMAGCVERAADNGDMDALKDLLPDLRLAVERQRIELMPDAI
jgi:hypothetical protein